VQPRLPVMKRRNGRRDGWLMVMGVPIEDSGEDEK
jgi:hypothetical protein